MQRLYGHHVQAGTLDDLLQSLRSKENAPGDEAGRRHVLIGLLLLQRGDDLQAADSFRRAQPLLPDDAMVGYYLGKTLLAAGQLDDAANALERAVACGPKRDDAMKIFTTLGRLYARVGKSDEALSVWVRLEKNFPGDVRVQEEVAKTLAEEGQLESALQRYQQLAAQASGESDHRAIGYRIMVAELKQKLGDSDAAIEDLESILQRLRPASWLYADVRRRIEAVFLRSGDYGGLSDYYKKQLAKQPDDLDLKQRYARSLAKVGQTEQAIAAMQDSIRSAPGNDELRLELIDICRRGGRHADAIKQYEALVKQNPAHPDYLIALGNTHLENAVFPREQRVQKAGEVWKRLAAARADDPVIAAKVADLLRSAEQTDDAIDFYNRAIRLAPTEPQYREYLGEYLHRLGRKQEALSTWRAIAAGERKSRENLIRLAEVLTVHGYGKESLDAIAEADTLDLSFEQRMRFVGLLRRAQRYQRALEQAAKAGQLAETREQRDRVLKDRLEIYADAGTLDQQIDEFQKQLRPDDADGYRTLAMMLDIASRRDDAINMIEAAIGIAPDDVSVLAVAAGLYAGASRNLEAVEIYQRLVNLDRRFGSSYLRRIAELQLQLGRRSEAIETGSQLIQSQSTNPDAFRFFADLCFKSGEEARGIVALRRALRIAPRETSIRNALASALASQYRIDEALDLHWQSLDSSNDLDGRNEVWSATSSICTCNKISSIS